MNYNWRHCFVGQNFATVDITENLHKGKQNAAKVFLSTCFPHKYFSFLPPSETHEFSGSCHATEFKSFVSPSYVRLLDDISASLYTNYFQYNSLPTSCRSSLLRYQSLKEVCDSQHKFICLVHESSNPYWIINSLFCRSGIIAIVSPRRKVICVRSKNLLVSIRYSCKCQWKMLSRTFYWSQTLPGHMETFWLVDSNTRIFMVVILNLIQIALSYACVHCLTNLRKLRLASLELCNLIFSWTLNHC